MTATRPSREGSTKPNWFSADDVSAVSHHGSPRTKASSGTLAAYVRAYDDGYRRFQVDVVPIKDDLISRHASFGRLRGYSTKTRDDVMASLPGVPTMRELLNHEKFENVFWNFEVKSKKSCDSLIVILKELTAAQRSRILLSSPARPSILKIAAKTFDTADGDLRMAYAAPVIHGGFAGRPLLGSRFAKIEGRPYDARQVWRLFVSKRPARSQDASLPIRQIWTVSKLALLRRCLRAAGYTDRIPGPNGAAGQYHLIVDSANPQMSRALTSVGLLPDAPPMYHDRPIPSGVKIEALALGGGGWRGTFGGIGVVMCLARLGKWNDIRDVVGISGGSFTVAALARQPGESETRHPATTDDPVPDLKWLMERLEGRALGIRSQVLAIVSQLGVSLIPVALGIQWAWRSADGYKLLLAAGGTLPFTTFYIRALLRVRFSCIIKHLYRRATFATTPVDSAREPSPTITRRFSLGATGLNDANLYSFGTELEQDAKRWMANPRLPTPLHAEDLAYAVIRASALPGLSRLRLRPLFLPTCSHPANVGHTKSCDQIPDGLVDGGISGIFGRGLIQQRLRKPPECENQNIHVLVVDSGRHLAPSNAETPVDRLRNFGERFTVIYHLVRWLQIAFEIGYRGDVRRTVDGTVEVGYEYHKVSLAEQELAPDESVVDVARAGRLKSRARLASLRDDVWALSLLRARRTQIDQAIAAGVAACALEFDDNPDIEDMLDVIGRQLGKGDRLAQAWINASV